MWPRICSSSKHSGVFAVLSFYGGACSKKFFMLQVSANLRPLLLKGPPMSVGESGLGFAIAQSIAEILQG